MADNGYTGYLFAFARDDLDPFDGLHKARIIAIAMSTDDAAWLATELVGHADFELIEAGAEIVA